MFDAGGRCKEARRFGAWREGRADAEEEGFVRGVNVVQKSAELLKMERETGVEPATSSLGSWHSTTELLPLAFNRKYINS